MGLIERHSQYSFYSFTERSRSRPISLFLTAPSAKAAFFGRGTCRSRTKDNISTSDKTAPNNQGATPASESQNFQTRQTRSCCSQNQNYAGPQPQIIFPWRPIIALGTESARWEKYTWTSTGRQPYRTCCCRWYAAKTNRRQPSAGWRPQKTCGSSCGRRALPCLKRRCGHSCLLRRGNPAAGIRQAGRRKIFGQGQFVRARR